MKMNPVASTLIVAGALVIALVALKPRIARAAMLKVGQVAPEISTQMVVGDKLEPFSLDSYRGHKVVLYFYPKDNTPGCTKEACGFRDGYDRFKQAGIEVFGCSVDSAKAHRAFIRKNDLPFPLLLDPGHKIAAAYGASNGIPIVGLDRRITYVIGEDGKILKVYPDVDPSIHADQILGDLGLAKPSAQSVGTPAKPAHAD